MLGLLRSLLTSCHLLAVSVVAVGPIVCLWLEWRGARQGDEAASEAGRRLAQATLWMLVIGAGLGAIDLAIVWASSPPSDPYLSAWALIPPRRIWFGVAELAFFALCMAGYVWGWRRMPRVWHRALAVLAATNLLYHFPPLFSAVTVASTRDSLLTIDGPLPYDRLMRLLFDAETLSRVAHMVLAAMVVTGVTLMWLGLPRRGEPSRETADHRPIAWGGRMALAAAVLQLPVGVWILWMLPPPLRDRFLMSDSWTTGLFAIGVVVVLGLLHHLAAAALGDVEPGNIYRAIALTAIVFLLMVAAGQRARSVARRSAAFSTHSIRHVSSEPTVLAAGQVATPLPAERWASSD